jgi:hypothetical protein
LNDIGRNSLLGNRKKIAKFLKRTFTCRSTFLYGDDVVRNCSYVDQFGGKGGVKRGVGGLRGL